MPMHLRKSSTIVRETHQDYRRRPLVIEVGPDGVFLWPKGTRQRAKINLEAAYERALANGAPPLPTGKQIGLSARYPGGMLAGTSIPLFNQANTKFVEESNRKGGT